MNKKYVKIESEEMKHVISFVKKMTKTMTFDENMESADWPRARRRNNLFYKLMPRQNNVKFGTADIGNHGALLSEYSVSDNKFLSVRSLRKLITKADLEEMNKEGSYHENQIDNNCIILYLHGGGFVTGSAFVCKSYCSMLAKFSKCRVYAAEYSLAPEKPFPYGFDDCCKAYEDIVKIYPDSKIIVMGESAGGNYSLALTLKYKNQGRIAGVIVHSPTVDFSGKLDHTKNINKDFIVKPGAGDALRRMYVGNNDSKNPYISPYYGDFAGFPPLYITCDVNETLYADAKALSEKCDLLGVDVTFVEFEGGYHACAISGTNTPETAEILRDNIMFIKSNV